MENYQKEISRINNYKKHLEEYFKSKGILGKNICQGKGIYQYLHPSLRTPEFLEMDEIRYNISRLSTFVMVNRDKLDKDQISHIESLQSDLNKYLIFS